MCQTYRITGQSKDAEEEAGDTDEGTESVVESQLQENQAEHDSHAHRDLQNFLVQFRLVNHNP